MAVAHGSVPASFDAQYSKTFRNAAGVVQHCRKYFTKEGACIGFANKRVGAHQPKKDRNKRK